jgi:nitronate monooxygenase
VSWRNTRITRRLDLAAPIVQGPFGSGLSAVDLVVAVCRRGLLGSFGVHHLSASGIHDVAMKIRSRTQRPFALNLWIPLPGESALTVSDEAFARARVLVQPYFEELGAVLPEPPAQFGQTFAEQVEAVLEARPAVFSFVYGIPDPQVLEQCRERDIVTLGTATTPAEALALQSAGVDMIVATGVEAGGHRVSWERDAEDCLTGTFALVPQVVDAVSVPVIAAGGIADGRGIAAAKMLGADAVQIGTAFLACDESGATALHRGKLFTTEPTRTALTYAFTGRLARGIRNRAMDELSAHRQELLPYPAQAWLMAQLKSAAVEAGRVDALALWSSQSAPLLQHRKADELIDALLQQTDGLLARV